jgi:hypothetical protein
VKQAGPLPAGRAGSEKREGWVGLGWVEKESEIGREVWVWSFYDLENHCIKQKQCKRKAMHQMMFNKLSKATT